MMNSEQNRQTDPRVVAGTTANPEPVAASIDPMTAAVQTDAREEVLQLLEERVVVDRSKRKVGDVIVRKEVETYMVEVPVRRERLIVEQVSPEHRELASIDLSQGEVAGVELDNYAAGNGITGTTASPSSSMVTVSFSSIEAAHEALSELAAQVSPADQTVRIDISLPSSASGVYQNLLRRSR